MFEECDMNDVGIAVMAGAIAGLVDVVFVGEPGKSMLGKFTDKMADNVVIRAAQMLWKSDSRPDGAGRGHKGEMPVSVAKCIEYLGEKYKVNYDIPTAGSDEGFMMNPQNHHFKSLAHSPDLIGLIFSILDQFMNTATFASNGQIIVIDTSDQESPLRGTNFISRLMCGIGNWFMHIISDMAGHESSRKNGERGAGVAIPGMELFNLCNFGSFTTGKNEKSTLSEVMVKVYSSGYDMRFGAALAIPVLLEEAIIKICWVIKARFYKNREWKDCVPDSKHGDLRVMLIIGNSALCVIDGVDAAVRSGGDWIRFFLRLNMVAWYRLIKMVLKEVFLRLGYEEYSMVEAMERINEELRVYLSELGEYDFDAIENEIAQLQDLDRKLLSTPGDRLTDILYMEIERQGITLPFKNITELDDFMNDDSSRLSF